MAAIPFAKWMRRVRGEMGMTQVDLAKAAEKHLALDANGNKQTLSNSFMSNIENGRRVPRPELAEALAVALGKPRSLGLFMSGAVPMSWLQVEADDERLELAALEDMYNDLNRLAMGSPVVMRGKERTHLSGKPDGSAKPVPG